MDHRTGRTQVRYQVSGQVAAQDFYVYSVRLSFIYFSDICSIKFMR